jgi:hypothetical protein
MVPARPATADAPATAPVAPPAPPPEVTPPPPAAPPRPAALPPVAARTAPLPDRQRGGGLFLPFLGLHSFQDSNLNGLDAGLRVGMFLGSYVNQQWSLNASAGFNWLNFRDLSDANAGVTGDASGGQIDLAFSPLFHVGNAKAEFVIGPKIGAAFFWDHVSLTNPGTNTSLTGDGWDIEWLLGGHMGVFVPASPDVLVGALLSLELHDVIHECGTATVTGAGTTNHCQWSGDSSTILGFAFALLL